MNTKLRPLLAALLAIGMASAFTGWHSDAATLPSAAPCMALLDRFTAPDVPAMGPGESVAPVGGWTNGITPPNLPGNGLAQHPMLYAGENYNKMFLINNGKVLWTYSTGGGNEYDDIWMLSNGNILFSRMQYAAEVTPKKEVVWRLDAPNGAEIHTVQPIGLDKVLLVENGQPAPKLLVINTKTKAVEVDHALDPCGGTHAQFRRIRMTAHGTYLAPYLQAGKVVEYDKDFNVIWSYNIKSPWAALRLKNGNTLITDEQDSLTREVNPKGETVWEFKSSELPEFCRFTSAPQSCTRLANGDTILCSRGNNGKGPQLVEVTPDKKVVWVLQDWKTLGSASAVQILDDPGIPENPGASEH
jgi:hypothetical protein